MTTTQKDIRREIAQRLKTAREKAGFSSAEAFCTQHHLALAQYQRHEDADLSMTASEIIKYCASLNVSMCFLMLGEEAVNLTTPHP